MTYQIRRIEPYGFAHPAIPVTAIGGAILAYLGIVMGNGSPPGMVSRLLIIGGSVVCGLAILAAIKPAISATIAVLALLGFAFNVFVVPDVQTAGLTFFQKLLETLIVVPTYTVLADALILAAAFFYNLFGALWGGIRLDIEQSGHGGE